MVICESDMTVRWENSRWEVLASFSLVDQLYLEKIATVEVPPKTTVICLVISASAISTSCEPDFAIVQLGTGT